MKILHEERRSRTALVIPDSGVHLISAPGPWLQHDLSAIDSAGAVAVERTAAANSGTGSLIAVSGKLLGDFEYSEFGACIEGQERQMKVLHPMAEKARRVWAGLEDWPRMAVAFGLSSTLRLSEVMIGTAGYCIVRLKDRRQAQWSTADFHLERLPMERSL